MERREAKEVERKVEDEWREKEWIGERRREKKREGERRKKEKKNRD